MRRRLAFAAVVAISAVAWLGPPALIDHFGSWWFLSGYIVTVPLCEACWWAHDRAGAVR